MLLFIKSITSAGLLFLAGQASATFTAKQIFQFPSSPLTAIENVAIRPNGQLILSIVTSATVYTLDPSESKPNSSLLHEFPGASSCLGITEIARDQYAIVVGNVSTTTYQGVPGSFSIWKMDFRKCPVAFSKIAAVSGARILNGLTHISSNDSIVLAADSAQGIIYSINTATGVVAAAFQDSVLAATTSFPLGVNGIHAAGNTLYYTNSARGTYGRIPIDTLGRSNGSATILAYDGSGSNYDDFVLDPANNAFITNHPYAVTEVIVGGAQSNLANSTTIVQPTSAIFGLDGKTLYVVTAGGKSSGSVVSGQVFALTPS